MSHKNNLLVGLSRWADRQGENFTTEAFVHLLNHLVAAQPAVAKRILADLTGNRFPRISIDPGEIRISTQDITQDGTPDIRIAAPEFLGYVEIKLGATLGIGQLSSYRRALQNTGIQQTSLTLLTRYPYDVPAGEEPDAAIRWFQVAQWLDREIASGTLDTVSNYLVCQFLEYLEALNITIYQVRSGISVGAKEFNEKYGTTLTNLVRFRSPQKLLEYPELVPLYQLMLLLGEAVAGVGLKVKFDMGKHNGGWVGYNLKRMDYFLFVSISKPETLVFETYLRPFDPLVWSGKIGAHRRDRKPAGWENELDLAEPNLGFFSLDKNRQLEVIQEFVFVCLREAEKCYPANKNT